jgi:hypothetical protein
VERSLVLGVKRKKRRLDAESLGKVQGSRASSERAACESTTRAKEVFVETYKQMTRVFERRGNAGNGVLPTILAGKMKRKAR